MAVTGDFFRLGLLRERLQRLADGGAQKDMLRALADRTQRLIIDGFNAKSDPYGRAWAPRKHALKHDHPLLDKSGRMINSFRSGAAPTAVRVTGLNYAGFHQDGTSRMVARPLLPQPERGLGPIWGDAYLSVSAAVARAYGAL